MQTKQQSRPMSYEQERNPCRISRFRAYNYIYIYIELSYHFLIKIIKGQSPY